MRDLTKREIELVLNAIDSSLEDEGVPKEELEKIMELFEMELALHEKQRKPPVSRKEKK